MSCQQRYQPLSIGLTMAIDCFFITLSKVKKIFLVFFLFIYSVAVYSDDGEAIYEYRCKNCHGAIDRAPEMTNFPGPNLIGIVGREAASDKNFANYSSAMKSLGYVWTDGSLDEFLTSPMQVVPGTIMAFIGIKDEDQRAALIDYLTKSTPVNSK